MPETYKILGQVAPSNTNEKVLYTSPVGTQTLVTNMTVANRSASSQTFDINVYNTAKVDNDFAPFVSNIFVSLPSTNGNTGNYSTDGVTWTQITVPSGFYRGIAYGAGRFVSSNVNSGQGLISTDGITWTTNGSGPRAMGIVYGSDKFVSVGYMDGSNTTRALNSTDGITWTVRTMTSSQPWQSVVFGNNSYVATAAATTTTAAFSTDGITWTTTSFLLTGYYTALAFGNNTFVAISLMSGTNATSSTDGITWTQRTMPVSAAWRAVAYGNNTFVAVADNTSSAATSTDGITWTTRTLPSSMQLTLISFGAGVFFAMSPSGAGSTSAASSTDGITWTLRTLASTASRQNLASTSFTTTPSSAPINNLYKNVTILPNQSEILEPGIVLGAQNSIVVSGNTNLTYSVYGVELS